MCKGYHNPKPRIRSRIIPVVTTKSGVVVAPASPPIRSNVNPVAMERDYHSLNPDFNFGALEACFAACLLVTSIQGLGFCLFLIFYPKPSAALQGYEKADFICW